ncbi:cellulase family glycosylhydrolase [Azospirillum agricola]|uniref:cellulase family glycosylhydrolase n=1 Tax=Azospirillum agricola TaxID=1720247 RepID=UPI000A0F06DF|nr:cellulase family glycosylhydrolase [Azospirillum agricola]SMH45944.1 Aryl-phospho-beta-D-glucosidase BglC, GH1 family [Azospirillum lipoferum]
MSKIADGFLSTSGNQIVDANGQSVRLIGVNWGGAAGSPINAQGEGDTLYAPMGLDQRNYKDMMDQMVAMGFNTIRIPISNRMLDADVLIDDLQPSLGVRDPLLRPDRISQWHNPDLYDGGNVLTPLKVLDKIVDYAGQVGLRIILDHHFTSHEASAYTAFMKNGLWYDDDPQGLSRVYDRETVEKDWVFLAKHYAGNPAVIGADLQNETTSMDGGKATWDGTGSATDWKTGAEELANAIHAVNKDWLLIVEGMDWSSNLSAVATQPIQLADPSAMNKLIYSPHAYSQYDEWRIDYAPGNTESEKIQNWANSFGSLWDSRFGYIYQQNIAPILVGEFGIVVSDEKKVAWGDNLVKYLNGDFDLNGVSNLVGNQLGMSATYWTWNADDNNDGYGLTEGESGGAWRDIGYQYYQHIRPLIQQTGGYLESIGGVGNDALTSGGGPGQAVFLDGGLGNDTLYGGTGDDMLFGGAVNADADPAGNATGGDDALYAGDGNDLADGGSGNDTVDGGAGNDTLIGGGGNDSILGGDGDDTLFGMDGTDTLLGGAGHDWLRGGTGNDSLNGGLGDDTLNGGAGADTLLGGGGDDTIDYGGSVHGVSVNLTTSTAAGGDAQGDVISGFSHAIGGDGNDTLFGDAGANRLAGGGGNDTLVGGDGNDTLIGGAGSDLLTGGAGLNRFEFTTYGNAGSADRITDAKTGDVIAVTGLTFTGAVTSGSGAGLGLGGIRIEASGNDTILHIGTDATPGSDLDIVLAGAYTAENFIASGSTITITDGPPPEEPASVSIAPAVVSQAEGNSGTTSFVFTLTRTGSTDTAKTVQWSVAGSGSAPADAADFGGTFPSGTATFAVGSPTATISVAVLGDTAVEATEGFTVTLQALPNDPTVFTTATAQGVILNDDSSQPTPQTYYLTSGPDNWTGTTVADQVFAGNGNDTVDGGDGNDQLFGEDGNDSLIGGGGGDQLYGGAGNDTLWGGAGIDHIQTGSGTDTIVFKLGDSYDYVDDFTAGAGGDVIDLRSITTIHSLADLTLTQSGANVAIDISPTDGLTLGNLQVSSLVEANFLFAPSQWFGTSGADVITGGDGVDQMYAAQGNDTLSGGAGNDQMFGEDGNDVLFGGAGNDVMSGGTGNDTLAGGIGNDYLVGGTGSDTFVMAPGDGYDYVGDFQAGSGGDIIDVHSIAGMTSLGAVMAGATQSGNDTGIYLGNGTGITLAGVSLGSLTAANFRFAATPEYGTANADQMIGTAGDDALIGLAGNDTLVGYIGDDSLLGGEGNDLLSGGDGADTLDGGAGNDYLEGGSGSDVFVFNPGGGYDYIGDFATAAGGDVIDLRGWTSIHGMADLTPHLTQSGSNLAIELGSTDGITLANVQMSSLNKTHFLFA